MERSGYWLHKWTDETSSFDPHGRWSGGLDCYERDYSMWIPDRIKPDDTVAVNDYIDRQFELSAEVADGFEVIDAADAQAAIAALQARVQELEAQHEDLVERNRILRHRPDLPVERTEFHDRFVKLQSQLTQRTAELEAAKAIQAIDLKNNNAYREQVATLQAELERVRGEIVAMRQRKDGAYLERNRVVAALASCFPSGIARTAIEGWDEEWHGCVYIDLPVGQVSWHYHDSHAHLFAHLPPYTKPWDGHTTEEKYKRVALLQHRQGMEG